jgi:Carboxypeptidase regulatory-like domain
MLIRKVVDSMVACCILATMCIAQESGAPNGVITGTVVGEDGLPLAGAQVHAEMDGTGPVGGILRYVKTDISGTFKIDQLALRTYYVIAGKEEDGYPDISFFYFYDRMFPKVSLTTAEPSKDVVLRLRRAAAVSGTVRDAKTGKPIGASFNLTVWETHRMFYSTSQGSDFRVLIPAAKDIGLEAFADGYKSWSYSDPSAPNRPIPLHLRSAEEIHLDVRLEPAVNPNQQCRRLLVPEGYVGWLRLNFGVKDAPAAPYENGVRVFKFERDGVTLNTSTLGPEKATCNEYLYYAADESVKPIPSDYWNDNGMIWGEYEGFSDVKRVVFGFFVGTKEQYEKRTNRR